MKVWTVFMLIILFGNTIAAVIEHNLFAVLGWGCAFCMTIAAGIDENKEETK